MKNLCRKERVHPSPPGSAGSAEVMAVLKLLPAAILALTAVLGADDKEVLAYLITRSINGPSVAGEETRRCRRDSVGGGAAHQAFNCGCFGCYISFWSRWDCSPDRELIHQAIEAFEENLASKERDGRGRRRERNRSERGRKGRKADEDVEKKVKGKKEVEPPAAVAADGGFAGEDGCSCEEKMAAEVEVEEEKEEVAVEESPRDEEPPLLVAAGGERRRGWPDVIELFNSRLWSLWGPAV